MLSMRGRGGRLGFARGGMGGYDAMMPGPSNFPLPSPRMLAMRAARARVRAMQAMEEEYMGW